MVNTHRTGFWHKWRRRFASRIEQPEWLDLEYGTLADVADNLDEMNRINYYLGGLRALTRHLQPRLEFVGRQRAPAEGVSVADLGTGAAEIPLTLIKWACQNGLRLRVVAVDWAERQLRIARARVGAATGITLVRADASCLPLPAQSVDFVISCLFAHHFSPPALASLLNSIRRVARSGLVMSDLVRDYRPWLAFQVLRPFFARSALTRHDGALSIQRAYTPAELQTIAEKAGLPRPRVYAHWPWRMTLVSDFDLGMEGQRRAANE